MSLVFDKLTAASALLALLSPSTALAVPLKAKPVRKSATRPASAVKVSDTEILARQFYANSVEADADGLYGPCNNARGDQLILAMDRMRSTLAGVATRSEFETKAEFEERQQNFASALQGEREVVFCFPLDEADGAVTLRYDADKEEFVSYFDGELLLKEVFTGNGTYPSQNSMGVKVIVKAYNSIKFTITLSNENLANSLCHSGSTGYSIRFAHPRDAAVSLKRDGWLVVRGRLRWPIYQRHEKLGEPTINNPSDVFTTTLTAFTDPRYIQIISPDGPVATCSFR